MAANITRMMSTIGGVKNFSLFLFIIPCTSVSILS
jgi:hypothetical protein